MIRFLEKFMGAMLGCGLFLGVLAAIVYGLLWVAHYLVVRHGLGAAGLGGLILFGSCVVASLHYASEVDP